MAVAPILSWEGLGLNQGSHWLFKDLDIQVGPRDRLALIGRNGAGKTTLLKLLSGEVEGDKGTRSVQPGTRIVTLEQDPFFTGYETLLDFTLSGKDAPPRHEVEAIAGQLGIDLSRKADSASGGERRRAALARALASEPDLLLLDEPTNHLDLAAIEWLENWLMRYNGAFVVISHDRTFLDRPTKATLWLDRLSPPPRGSGFRGPAAREDPVNAQKTRGAGRPRRPAAGGAAGSRAARASGTATATRATAARPTPARPPHTAAAATGRAPGPAPTGSAPRRAPRARTSRGAPPGRILRAEAPSRTPPIASTTTSPRAAGLPAAPGRG